MTRLLGFTMLSVAMAIAIYLAQPYAIYLNNGETRLQSLWNTDYLQSLQNSNTHKKLLSSVSKIDFFFGDPQVANELKSLKAPYKLSPHGNLYLKIEVIRWIENNRYGYVLQHEFFESSQENSEKIYEFGRTYSVGFFW